MSANQWKNYDGYKNKSDRIKNYYQGVSSCIRQVLLQAVRTKVKRVLDIGCGYGESTELLSEFAESVVGIDSSQTLIDLARQRHYRAKVEFQCSAFEEVQLHNASFDIVSGVWLLNHIHTADELKQILQKIRSLLKSEGLAVFVVPSDSFTTPRIQKIALNDFGWEQAWTVEEPEFTRGLFYYGEEWIRTTVWQPIYLMRLLDRWFDVRSWDVKGTLIAEKILPDINAGPSFEVIYGQLRSEDEGK